jgi:hypothetical protein
MPEGRLWGIRYTHEVPGGGKKAMLSQRLKSKEFVGQGREALVNLHHPKERECMGRF